jgi:hypothetical protein
VCTREKFRQRKSKPTEHIVCALIRRWLMQKRNLCESSDKRCTIGTEMEIRGCLFYGRCYKSLNENESKLGGTEFVFQPSLTADLLVCTSF